MVIFPFRVAFLCSSGDAEHLLSDRILAEGSVKVLIELSDDRPVRDKSLSSIGQLRKERLRGCAGCSWRLEWAGLAARRTEGI